MNSNSTRKRLTAVVIAVPIMLGALGSTAWAGNSWTRAGVPATADATKWNRPSPTSLITHASLGQLMPENGRTQIVGECEAYGRKADPDATPVRSLSCTIYVKGGDGDWHEETTARRFYEPGRKSMRVVTPTSWVPCGAELELVLTAGHTGGSYKVGIARDVARC